MEKDLILSVKNAVQALYGAEIGDAQVTLQKTKKEFVGDWTLVCFPLLKISRKNRKIGLIFPGGCIIICMLALKSFEC